ncbi:MAG: ShlB/FhaC/HecB family hemolysin secretion/activation protein [Variovorax sp.]|nr:MAG: ShlB/FhaC/HecB family hemolysin secretion/activation protein [Variovorax sp.]
MPMRYHRVGLALALAGTVSTLYAQTPAGNPLSQLPAPAPVPSPAEPAPQVDVRTPAGPAAGRLAQSFVPTRFDIEGVNALAFADVARRFAPLVGKPTTPAQLVAVAAEVTTAYKDGGLPLSFVYIPDQSFAGGVVRVVAVEGYIASVRIEGDAGPAEPKLREMAERLLADRPMRLANFERVTQLLTRLPGLSVAAEASMPGTTDGATALVLKVKRQPYNVSVGADLRQPTSRAVLTGVWNDPLLAGSQLSASTLLGNYSREKLLTLGYSQLVGSDGLTLKAQATRYDGYPDQRYGEGAPLERRNDNRRVELSAAYPLLLNARTSVTLSGGFYGVDNTDDYRVPATGVTLTDQTRVRALFAQLAYADAQPERARSASLMLAHGLDALGASATLRSNVPALSGPGSSKLDFTRLSLDASQRDRFASQWGTAFGVGAQYSPHSLAASERVAFGGARFGRGYAAGDGAGDSGWGVSAELNRAFRTDGQWLKQVEPYLLLEAARVSTRLGRPSPEQLRSVALGIRLTDAKHYNLDLAVAKPTGDASIDNPQRKVRLSVQLSYQLAGL